MTSNKLRSIKHYSLISPICRRSSSTSCCFFLIHKFDFISRFNDVKENFAEDIELTLFQRAKDPKSNPVILIFALKGLLPDKYKDNAQVNDETAKDIMKELKTKFRGIKFDESESADTKTAQQQAEDILRGKSGEQ